MVFLLTHSNCLQLDTPYLVFIGDTDNPIYAKTGLGLVQWCPEHVAGQLRFDNNFLDLGVPDMQVKEAVSLGIKSLVIGVAPIGGSINSEWIDVLVNAAQQGLSIVSGLHLRLESFPALVAAAKASGAKLINVRTPPVNLPIGDGQKRSGQRVLMVGTDCSVGKKYTALALTKSLLHLGVNATFRATGQTGIMIAGTGVPLDSVVSDFVAGAAEVISPGNEDDHWDVIEGQGSLFNPSYGGVSLGLLHGSQPDAVVVCHDASRFRIESCPHILLPSIKECIDLHLRCGRLTNPNIYCVAVSINTSTLAAEKRQPYLEKIQKEVGLLCVDPMIESCDAIAKALLIKK